MGIFQPNYSIKNLKDGYNYSLTNSKFNQFNPSMLGLGDISREGERIDALAAIFDLEGFTSFSNHFFKRNKMGMLSFGAGFHFMQSF
jgi:hypothetical protein